MLGKPHGTSSEIVQRRQYAAASAGQSTGTAEVDLGPVLLTNNVEQHVCIYATCTSFTLVHGTHE